MSEAIMPWTERTLAAQRFFRRDQFVWFPRFRRTYAGGIYIRFGRKLRLWHLPRWFA